MSRKWSLLMSKKWSLASRISEDASKVFSFEYMNKYIVIISKVHFLTLWSENGAIWVKNDQIAHV